jgi:hypothetical protein
MNGRKVLASGGLQQRIIGHRLCVRDSNKHWPLARSWFVKSGNANGSLGLSAASQQYFSLRTNQPPTTSQRYASLRTNQHQPLAPNQPNLPQRGKASGIYMWKGTTTPRLFSLSDSLVWLRSFIRVAHERGRARQKHLFIFFQRCNVRTWAVNGLQYTAEKHV